LEFSSSFQPTGCRLVVFLGTIFHGSGFGFFRIGILNEDIFSQMARIKNLDFNDSTTYSVVSITFRVNFE